MEAEKVPIEYRTEHRTYKEYLEYKVKYDSNVLRFGLFF